jgi:hypothetical protein
MVEHWTWYVSGIALASVPIVHSLVLKRSLAVSGRFSALVNRVRLGRPEDEVDMTSEEMLAAVREATIAAFGADAVAEGEAVTGEAAAPPRPERQSTTRHLLFLGGMLLGGVLSALLARDLHPSFRLESVEFARIFGSGPGVGTLVLVVGGVLVGFGTRMAAGCTTGHGLCGVSRFQKASMLSTAAFFGAAVMVSLALRFLS